MLDYRYCILADAPLGEVSAVLRTKLQDKALIICWNGSQHSGDPGVGENVYEMEDYPRNTGLDAEVRSMMAGDVNNGCLTIMHNVNCKPPTER